MKKILTALIAATAFSAMALTMSNTADARWGYAGYRGVGYHGGYRLPGSLVFPTVGYLDFHVGYRAVGYRGLGYGLWFGWVVG